MRFTGEEENNARGRDKGRKITDIIFDFSWKPDQMNLPIEEPKKDGKFDIFDLRKRLKKYAELSVAEVDDIMKQLKQKTPAERKTFVLAVSRSEEHTSELQSRFDLVCRLLLE